MPVLPELDELGVLDKGKLSLKEYQPPKAEIAYYLDEENGKMTARAQCSYGETKIDLTDREAFEQEGAFRDRDAGETGTWHAQRLLPL